MPHKDRCIHGIAIGTDCTQCQAAQPKGITAEVKIGYCPGLVMIGIADNGVQMSPNEAMEIAFGIIRCALSARDEAGEGELRH
jgi:hypothetical protein